MTPATENLYDKWSGSDWHQLWADDYKAFVFMPVENNPDEMFVIVDDGELASAVIMPWTEAFPEWNSLINDHLAEKKEIA